MLGLSCKTVVIDSDACSMLIPSICNHGTCYIREVDSPRYLLLASGKTLEEYELPLEPDRLCSEIKYISYRAMWKL